MTAFRNRLLGLTSGTLALSYFSSMAYAQTTKQVLVFTGSGFHSVGGDADSTFTFNQSMILNNIGWVYDSSMASNTVFAYQTGFYSGGVFHPGSSESFTVTDLDTVTSSGLRYLKSFTPRTMAIGDYIGVAAIRLDDFNFYATTGFSPNDSVVGVTHSPGVIGNAAGNLRVTPLGGSVAPEPGSFALALTGGAALIGICIRRRRNAA